MDEIIIKCKEIGMKILCIEDIYLYGSYARGEEDKNSDIDILIVIDDDNYDNIISIKNYACQYLGIPIDWISIYSTKKLEELKKYGSYFLWHIKLEGKKIYSKKNYLKTTIEYLPKYIKCEMDLIQYKSICIDILESINSDRFNIYYELNLLASVVRNSSIAFCFLDGKYIFGRCEPVLYVKNNTACGEKINLNEYNKLYQYRILYNRGGEYKTNKNLKPFILEWLTIAINIIDISMEKLKGR